jgi:hypothetical protein
MDVIEMRVKTADWQIDLRRPRLKNSYNSQIPALGR